MNLFRRKPKPKPPTMTPLQQMAVRRARMMTRSFREAEERALLASLAQSDLKYTPTARTPRWRRVWYWIRRHV